MSKPRFHVHIPDRAAFDAQFVTVDPEGNYHLNEESVVYQGFFRVTLTRDNKTLSWMKISLSDAEKYLRPLVDAGLCGVLGASGTVTGSDTEQVETKAAVLATERTVIQEADADALIDEIAIEIGDTIEPAEYDYIEHPWERPALHTEVRDVNDLPEAEQLLVKEIWPEGFEPSIDDEGNEYPPAKMWGWLA